MSRSVGASSDRGSRWRSWPRTKLRSPCPTDPLSTFKFLPIESSSKGPIRLLIFTQYFPPEIGATQTRLHTFAKELASRGHDVEVVCQVPNHPQGVVRPGFRGKALVRRRGDGFKARHVWVHTRPEKTSRDRLAFYATYGAMATAVGALTRRPDVIFASSPPLPVALAGALVAKRHRIPWVMDVRDLWPTAAVAMGELSDGRALDFASRLERWLYEQAAAITVVTEPFIERIGAVYQHPEIHLVPNGTTQFWLDAARVESNRARFGLPDDEFIWTFAGNVGGAQGLEAAIEAAGLLGPGFRLQILGNGPARRQLEKAAESLAPGSVEFRDQVAPEVARQFLRSSDALLVSLAPDPVFEDFVPSKLYDFSAVGRPVVVAAAGEPTRQVQEAGSALAVSAGDPESLADAIRTLSTDHLQRAVLTRAGFELASRNLREASCKKLESVLLEASTAQHVQPLRALRPRDNAERLGQRARLRLLVNGLSAHTGGGKTYLSAQLKALARRDDVEVTVLGTETLRRHCDELDHVEFVSFPRIPLLLRVVLLEQLLVPLLARRYDALYSPGNMAALLSSVPQVVVFHNPNHFGRTSREVRREHYARPHRSKKAVQALVARLSVWRAHRSVAISESIRTTMREDLGGHIDLIHSAPPASSAVGTDAAVDGICLDERLAPDYVLSVANDYPHKDWDGLIRTFSGRRHLPQLVIVGECRSRAREQELNRRISGTSRVVLYGAVESRKELRALYRGARWYIAHSRLEAFPLTPFEALAEGVPVLASDIPPHREVCEESAQYYDVDDGASLARMAAEKPGAGPERPSLMSRTWDQNVDEFLVLLRSAVGEAI